MQMNSCASYSEGQSVLRKENSYCVCTIITMKSRAPTMPSPPQPSRILVKQHLYHHASDSEN